MNKITISLEINVDELKSEIENADSLNDNQKVFKQLALVGIAKKQVEDALELVKQVESQAKLLIDDKAKALYGVNWSAIAGQGYKVTKSLTGTVYEIGDPEKAKEYIKVEVKPDSDKIKDYIKSHSSLPDGIDYNPNRGSSIKITVNEDS